MCGIAGKVRSDGKDERVTLERMVARLRHRGPDRQAVVDVDGVATLGHARLSIIELSSLGDQPMQDERGRLTLVYNGEVYNFQALRRELEAAGRRFRGNSDTEVVLNAYDEWGKSAFARFNGMFALALWDRERRELVLARDRFGKKPLYYSELGGAFAFASEIGALLTDEDIGSRARYSIAGMNHYLALGYILGPLSAYDGIFKLEPASYLVYRDGRIVERTRYWEYHQCFRRRTRESEGDVVEHLAGLLDESVRLRLVSDVPVGTFLSGGVDSSGIAALAQRHLTYDLHSFTIGFSQASYDESEDARRMADQLGTIHHARLILEEEGRPLIERAVACYDEPFSDTSLVPMVEVARLAAAHMRVVLSGDGGDELFAGYVTYLADDLKRRLDVFPLALRRLAAAALARLALPSRRRLPLAFRLRQFAKGLAASREYAHYAWRELHDEEERIALIGAEHADEIRATHPFGTFARYFDEVADLDPLSQQLYVDAKTWLVDDILVKIDRATMAFSLEARAPFLDARLAEYAASLPPELKLRRGQPKYVLKQAMRRLLPRRTVEKKKSGFNAPIRAWLGGTGTNEFTFFNRYVAEKHGLPLAWRPAR